jgi:flagellar hook-associated protein 2
MATSTSDVLSSLLGGSLGSSSSSSSSASSALSPLFQASGIASGLDTGSIVTALTQIASQPITQLQSEQAATRTQISTLGTLASQLSALQTAADALGKNGALGVSVLSSNSSFSATASPSATAGSYLVSVGQLATAASARSQAFASADAPVTGGNLALTINGSTTNVAISDGEALSDVAFAINQSGAPVSAAILNDGTNSYLSITNRQTGYTIGGSPGDALSIAETSTGTQGQALSASIVVPAQNAQFTVNNLSFTRTSNSFNDAIPGVTINLNAPTAGSPETLTLDNDPTATQNNLQKFVDAYNAVMQTVEQQFNISGTTDTTSMLTNDPAVRSLQASLHGLIQATVGTGSVTSLADLGIETQQDGTLSLDTTKLQNAITNNPSAINSIFQDATSGLAKAVDTLTQSYTDPVSGIFTLDSKGMSDRVNQMDDQIAQIQVRVNNYHDTLIQQFTDMETIVSNMKTVGNYLTSQSSKTG